jgi:glycerophosphoryl diester phosphodiesterase
MYAFEKAVAMGVDVLETDIHSTADGVLVVRHDPTVDATTNGTGYISDFRLAELRELDAGYRWTGDNGIAFPYREQGITIPTLDEVLYAFPGIRVNIDIKPKDALIIGPFCQMLKKFDKLDRVLVGSFHDDQIRRFRNLCPQVATAAGVMETRLFYGLNRVYLESIYRPNAEAFQIPEYANGMHIVTPRFVRGAQSQNIQVHVWTVNEEADMQRLMEWGVVGIITDYPDRLMKILGR